MMSWARSRRTYRRLGRRRATPSLGRLVVGAFCFAASPSPKEMLRRKPTRIELKPDDRDEYFDHKNKNKPDSSNKDDKYSKDVRIGLSKPR